MMMNVQATSASIGQKMESVRISFPCGSERRSESVFCSTTADYCISTHGKSPEPFHLHRHCMKPEAAVRQLVKVTQVLADGDVGAEQDRMSRSFASANVVDIQRIDACQHCALLFQ